MSTIRLFLSSLLIVTCMAGCLSPAALAQSDGPTAPINNPNLLGKTNQAVQTIATLADLETCVAVGKPAYGVTVQTTNVRVAPGVAACRIGKIAKGNLVEITGYATVTPTAGAAQPAVSTATGSKVGYAQDILPIFNRVCSTCHSSVAKTVGLQVTEYEPLMTGSMTGTVVLPGDVDGSRLWQMVSTGRMPMIGALTDAEKELIRQWILGGAAEHRAARPAVAAASTVENGTWLAVGNTKLTAVADKCAAMPAEPQKMVSADLIVPVSCGAPPASAELKKLVAKGLAVTSGQTATKTGSPAPVAASGTATGTQSAAPEVTVAAPPAGQTGGADAAQAGIQVTALGLPTAADSDPYLTPRGGFCIERRLPDNQRGVTAIAFAPDGRMFLALDSNLATDIDPNILYDAYHPSRSIAVYDYVNNSDEISEILQEAPRITGLDYHDGALYVSRSGEVGRIPDGGSFETLASGFSVESRLFHSNNGIVVNNGWVYMSNGGVRDGYVDPGPIVDVGEEGAQQIVSGGNPYAARIVRAPLDTLLSTRNINAFSTAARGVRNPYGITRDPAGRLWFTDNGATNVPETISAGDEVNSLDPGAIGGDEGSTPYYGFPLALNGSPPDWYATPVATLPNSAAPTGITWAYDTIFYGQYGHDPGLYRLGRAEDGGVTAERIMVAWPVLAVATAPDGAVWVGMGDGGLYRLTPGCNS